MFSLIEGPVTPERSIRSGVAASVAVEPSPPGDYRPWPEIEAWAREIAAELTPQPVM
jgi:hypothetical protein